MLEELASSRFGFWIIAWTIAAADSAFLLRPGKFGFSLTQANRTQLRVSLSPFTLRNKELVSSIASFPFQLFFITDIDSQDRPTQETRRTLSAMRRLLRRVRILAALSALSAFILALGPCVSAIYGTPFSVITLLPILYLIAINTSLVLWLKRRAIGLNSGTALKISAEIILCPVLIINVLKRISLAREWDINTLNAAQFSDGPDQTISAVHENMKYHSGK
jgi:hypothetical protein